MKVAACEADTSRKDKKRKLAREAKKCFQCRKDRKKCTRKEEWPQKCERCEEALHYCCSPNLNKAEYDQYQRKLMASQPTLEIPERTWNPIPDAKLALPAGFKPTDTIAPGKLVSLEGIRRVANGVSSLGLSIQRPLSPPQITVTKPSNSQATPDAPIHNMNIDTDFMNSTGPGGDQHNPALTVDGPSKSGSTSSTSNRRLSVTQVLLSPPPLFFGFPTACPSRGSEQGSEADAWRTFFNLGSSGARSPVTHTDGGSVSDGACIAGSTVASVRSIIVDHRPEDDIEIWATEQGQIWLDQCLLPTNDPDPLPIRSTPERAPQILKHFIKAVRLGDIEAFKGYLALDGMDNPLNAPSMRFKALQVALCESSASVASLAIIVEELIGHGARIDECRPEDGKSILHLLAGGLDNGATQGPAFVDIVNKLGTKLSGLREVIGKVDKEGRTFLHRSWFAGSYPLLECLQAYPEILEQLIRVVNVQDDSGSTPLHWQHYDMEVFNFLLSHTRNVCVTNRLNLTPLNALVLSDSMPMVSSRETRRIYIQISSLLRAGASIGADQIKTGKLEHTILYTPMRPAILSFLLEPRYRINVNVQNRNGQTPLQWAIAGRFPGGDPGAWAMACKLIIKGGANVNIQDNCGKTPLLSILEVVGDALSSHEMGLYGSSAAEALLLCRMGRTLAELLVHNHADPDIEDSNGESARSLAVTYEMKWNRSLLLNPQSAKEIDLFNDETPSRISVMLEGIDGLGLTRTMIIWRENKQGALPQEWASLVCDIIKDDLKMLINTALKGRKRVRSAVD